MKYRCTSWTRQEMRNQLSALLAPQPVGQMEHFPSTSWTRHGLGRPNLLNPQSWSWSKLRQCTNEIVLRQLHGFRKCEGIFWLVDSAAVWSWSNVWRCFVQWDWFSVNFMDTSGRKWEARRPPCWLRSCLVVIELLMMFPPVRSFSINFRFMDVSRDEKPVVRLCRLLIWWYFSVNFIDTSGNEKPDVWRVDSAEPPLQCIQEFHPRIRQRYRTWRDCSERSFTPLAFLSNHYGVLPGTAVIGLDGESPCPGDRWCLEISTKYYFSNKKETLLLTYDGALHESLFQTQLLTTAFFEGHYRPAALVLETVHCDLIERTSVIQSAIQQTSLPPPFSVSEPSSSDSDSQQWIYLPPSGGVCLKPLGTRGIEFSFIWIVTFDVAEKISPISLHIFKNRGWMHSLVVIHQRRHYHSVVISLGTLSDVPVFSEVAKG